MNSSSSAVAVCGPSEGDRHLNQMSDGPGFKMAHKGMGGGQVGRKASSWLSTAGASRFCFGGPREKRLPSPSPLTPLLGDDRNEIPFLYLKLTFSHILLSYFSRTQKGHLWFVCVCVCFNKVVCMNMSRENQNQNQKLPSHPSIAGLSWVFNSILIEF